jgi:hypothetical protein
VIWRDPAANVTVGYILSPRDPHIDAALHRLPSHFFEVCHLLVVPTGMYETELSQSATRLAAIEDALLNIEGERHPREASSMVSPTQRLSQFQLELNLILDQNLQRASLMGEFLQRQPDILEQRTVIAGQTSLNSNTKGLQERLSLLKSSREHLAIYEGLRTRIRARLEAVSRKIATGHAFISQSTNSLRPSTDLSRGIAFEMAAHSRRSLMAEEESTMTARVIVMLTTIFVPSTFVAVRTLS